MSEPIKGQLISTMCEDLAEVQWRVAAEQWQTFRTDSCATFFDTIAKCWISIMISPERHLTSSTAFYLQGKARLHLGKAQPCQHCSRRGRAKETYLSFNLDRGTWNVNLKVLRSQDGNKNNNFENERAPPTFGTRKCDTSALRMAHDERVGRLIIALRIWRQC